MQAAGNPLNPRFSADPKQQKIKILPVSGGQNATVD
jgi:hypothetical protein